jgi:hypothetical protein
MFPMNRKVLTDQPVVLEYLNLKTGKRVRKEFPNSFKSRAAYARLYREGKEPHVVAKPATN